MHTSIGLVALFLSIPNTFCSFETLMSPFASKAGLVLSTIGLGVGIKIWNSAKQDLNNYTTDEITLDGLLVKMFDPKEELTITNDYLDRFIEAASKDPNLFRNMPYAVRNNLTIQIGIGVRPSQDYNESLKLKLKENKEEEAENKINSRPVLFKLSHDQIFFVLHSRIHTLDKKSCERVIKAIGHHTFSSTSFECFYQKKNEGAWANASGVCSCCEEGLINSGKTVPKQIDYINKETIPTIKREIKQNYTESLSQRNKAIGFTVTSACCLGIGAYLKSFNK